MSLIVDFDISKISNKVILTGAGFSANWKFPLASELTTELLTFTTKNKLEHIKEILLDDQYVNNFEKLYEIIRTDIRFNKDDLEHMNNFITELFNEHHKNYSYQTSNLRINTLELLNKSISGNEKRFFFTVNFDILLEILTFTSGDFLRPTIPGFNKIGEFSINLAKGRGDIDNYLRRYEFSIEKVEEKISKDLEQQGPLFYVKLHGSYNWIREDNKSLVLLGEQKEEKMKEKENLLLMKYRELFQRVMLRPNLKILVIGYSFRDPHLDEILLAAVRNGAKLYIISPSNLVKWLQESDTRRALQKGLDYYYPGTFSNMEPRKFRELLSIFNS